MLRAIIAVPVLLVLVLFALTPVNRTVVTLGFWPTDYAVSVPLALVILGAMAVAFLLGALVLWMRALSARARARRAERHVRMLEAQVAELKARLAPPPPPGSLLPPVRRELAPVD